MPVNALRKKGARMSLQEAYERVEKLKRLTQSSNPHEAALAAQRLQTFDIDAARAPRSDTLEAELASTANGCIPDKPIEVLAEWPTKPYREIGEVEAKQPPDKKRVNWDELHFELLATAKKMGADAIVDIKLQGTSSQKLLSGTALEYLKPQEILEMHLSNKLEDDEIAHEMAQKERRDEDTAPGIG